MATVLVISSQPDECEAIAQDVVSAGFDANTTTDLASAIVHISDDSPSLILLDLLDRTLGPESIWRQHLQECPKDIPVMLLLPEEGLDDFAFPAQVADFILVPFVKSELTARLNLALGHKSVISGANVLSKESLAIDLERYEVTIGGNPIELTLKEFELLRFLMENPGRVHTRESLMNQVWGYDYFGGTRTVDVHIRRIRAKLEPDADEFIETVRGVGYRFRD